MLLNVKDSHNQPFINKEGTLLQGINFYANNDSNYHQTVEEPTGKKDLIAYHNISQDNLDAVCYGLRRPVYSFISSKCRIISVNIELH